VKNFKLFFFFCKGHFTKKGKGSQEVMKDRLREIGRFKTRRDSGDTPTIPNSGNQLDQWKKGEKKCFFRGKTKLRIQ